MPKIPDLTGQQFGRLLVEGPGRRIKGQPAWSCRCTCGTEVTVRSYSLVNGDSKSCGCFHREQAGRLNLKHGAARISGRTAEYRSWKKMRERCLNARDPAFARYGGRGIRICERWHDFENFLADMGPRPAGTSLDRFPNGEGHYEPGNCRWATVTEQNRNRRVVKLNPDLVREVLGRAEHGEGRPSIQRRLGLTKATVCDVLLGRSWREIFAESPASPASLARARQLGFARWCDVPVTP